MSSGTREGHGRVSGCANRVCLSFAGEYSGERPFSGRLFGVGWSGAIDYFPLCPGGEVGDRHLADVALAVTPHSHPLALHLAVADRRACTRSAGRSRPWSRGYSSTTAVASTCAASWRISSSASGLFGRDDLERSAVLEARGQVAHLAVLPDRQRHPGQALPDGAGDIGACCAVLELERTAVGDRGAGRSRPVC